MATYTELVTKTLRWANRDIEIFGDTTEAQYLQLHDFFNYAADSAYRKLRVVPLEATRTYTVAVDQDGETALTIPSDTIEFIQLSRIDEDGTHLPYSSKLDIRSFRELVEQLDGYVGGRDNPDLRFWTRHQGELLIYPPFNTGDVFELYYYRRLPSPSARYQISIYNLDEMMMDLNVAGDATNDYLYKSDTMADLIAFVEDTETSDVFTVDPTLSDQIRVLVAADLAAGGDFENYDNLEVGNAIVGKLTFNWLRGENEKVLLFGGLAEIFDYLEEPEQSQNYHSKFMRELDELNMEDKDRIPSGGTVSINYGSRLL